MATRLQWRRRITGLAIATWLGVMLLLGASLLAKHVVALPISISEQRLGPMLRQFRGGAATGKWGALHVLYSECRCSQRIVAHLLTGTRPKGWDERVLWVGPSAPDPALATRYRVERISTNDLVRFGIDSAPFLVVVDPNNEVRYAAGYTSRKQGPNADDLRIFAEAQAGQNVATNPVFGCAVSERLRRQLSLVPGL